MLSIKPKDPKTWHDKGVAFAEQGKYRRSIKCFNKALKFGKSDDVTTLDSKAVSLMFLKRYNKVIEIYTKIIEKNPDYQKAYDNRGRAYFKIEKYKKALKDWKKSLKMEEGKPFVCRVANVGLALLALGKEEEARSYFEKAESFDKNFKEKCFH